MAHKETNKEKFARQHRDDKILGRQSVLNLYITVKSQHTTLGRGEEVGGEGLAPLCHTGPQLEWVRVIIISVLQSIKQLGQPVWEEATSIIFFR